MVKVKALKPERKKVKAQLRKYYGGNHTELIIKKLAESGVTVDRQDVYKYYSYGIGEHGNKILEASYLLIEEGKIETENRAIRLNSISNPQKSASL